MSQLSKVLATLILIISSHQAFAHSEMAKSIPADGAIVQAAVTSLELDFSEPTRLTMVAIEQSETGKTNAILEDLPQMFVDNAKLPIEPLGVGDYVVRWTAVSKDGHVIKGEFAFTIEN